MAYCPGEAHDNPEIDTCGVCAPHWGWVQSPKPNPDNAGLIATRRNRIEIGEWVSVYVAIEQDIETDDGCKYIVICESHASIIEVGNNKRDAFNVAGDPTSFCDTCREIEAAGFEEYHREHAAERKAERTARLMAA